MFRLPILSHTHSQYLSQIRITEMEVNKAKNMIEHQDEIYSRPPRVWFKEKKTGQKRVRGEEVYLVAINGIQKINSEIQSCL